MTNSDRGNAPSRTHRGRLAHIALASCVLAVGCTSNSEPANDSTPKDAETERTTTIPTTSLDIASITTTSTTEPPAVTIPVEEPKKEELPKTPFDASGSDSPLAVGYGYPEPEYQADSTATTHELASGNYDALIRQIEESGTKVLVDVVELYLNGDAVRAALEDGQISAPEELLSNFYVRNPNPKMRLASLSNDVSVSGALGSKGGLSNARSMILERLGTNPLVPYRITVSDNVITAIDVPDVSSNLDEE